MAQDINEKGILFISKLCNRKLTTVLFLIINERFEMVKNVAVPHEILKGNDKKVFLNKTCIF